MSKSQRNWTSRSHHLLASCAKHFVTKYPATVFRIFHLREDFFQIVLCDPEFLATNDLEKLRLEIVPIGLALTFAEVETDGAVELDITEFLSLTSDMGTARRFPEIENTLRLRHPQLEIANFSPNGNGATLTLPIEQKNEDLTDLEADLVELPFARETIQIQFSENASPGIIPEKDVFTVAHRFARSPEIQGLKHVQEDDERWYDEFSRAAEAELNRNDFNFWRSDEPRSIFLPANAIWDLPDLRNYFLLYDQVIMEVPSPDLFEAHSYGLSEMDFAAAAERGRLKLLVTQPEERLPFGLLREVENANPHSIIGRRQGSAYAMGVLAERFVRFERLNDDTRSAIKIIGKTISQLIGIDEAAINRILAAPVVEYYTALSALRHNDLKRISGGSAEDLFEYAKAILDRPDFPDLRLEFMIAQNCSTIAGVFDAELALGTTKSPLAFPSCLCSTQFALFGDQFASLIESADTLPKTDSGVVLHPEGPLFEFSRTRPLTELLEIVEGTDVTTANSILSDLAVLDADERTNRVHQLNNVLASFAASPASQVIGQGMPTRLAKLIGTLLFGFVPVVSSVMTAAQLADDATSFANDLNALRKLDEDVPKVRAQIEFLSKVRRVAQLSERGSSS